MICSLVRFLMDVDRSREHLQEIVDTLVCEDGIKETVATPTVTLERPKYRAHGDWTTNVAFSLAGILRKAPSEIARNLAQIVRDRAIFGDAYVAAVGGYVNITLSHEQYAKILVAILTSGARYGITQTVHPQKVIIEYVSANPTGPIHLGNARGGPYGDVLAKVLTAVGHHVVREYYINDAGNQVEILGHSILGDDQAQYAGTYIVALRERLLGQHRNADARAIGEMATQIIVDEIIRPSLAAAHITFDRWFSEKILHESGAVDATVTALTQKGYTYKKDGASYFRATDFGDDKDRVLIKADGSKTYFCVDAAYHCDKLRRADRLINIWGADHGGTVARLRGALTALGHNDVLDVILTQFVRVVEDGKEVKMSKRHGTYITLADLVDDVGVDVVRFTFLMQSATSHIVFDLARAREQSDKNPVYYVQYAHARMASVLRKAMEYALSYDDVDATILTHERERALMQTLTDFAPIITRTADDYGVHRLPHYAIRIADDLHAFYATCTVIDKNDIARTKARLALVDATKQVLFEVLQIIGVAAPEKM